MEHLLDRVGFKLTSLAFLFLALEQIPGSAGQQTDEQDDVKRAEERFVAHASRGHFRFCLGVHLLIFFFFLLLLNGSFLAQFVPA